MWGALNVETSLNHLKVRNFRHVSPVRGRDHHASEVVQLVPLSKVPQRKNGVGSKLAASHSFVRFVRAVQKFAI